MADSDSFWRLTCVSGEPRVEGISTLCGLN